MCGFSCILNKSKTEVDVSVLLSMSDAIHYRGPDDEGYYIFNNLGLSHKRLSIIDLVSGHQPMTSNENTIVFNGEIYNYIELKSELKNKGYSFKTSSDTEVILKMYEEYGENLVEHLDGMFAFIIHDKQKNNMLIARDHFGIKPLYYYNDSELFLLASEIKALLKHPSVRPELNQESLHEYLTFQFILGENTLFKNIYKVLPGYYMIYDLNTNKTRYNKYWEPDFRTDVYHTEDYFVDKLRFLLEDTIQKQLRSDVPIGTFLSGGLDSSLVTLLAADKYPAQIQTFTGAFHEGIEFDETRYAREVIKKADAKAFEVFPGSLDFITKLPELIYHLDEPVVGPGLFPQYMVAAQAAENVKVVLGGQGGDEIFGGYTRYIIAYLEQAIKGAIYETNEEGEHIVSLKSILPNLPYLQQYMPMMKDFYAHGAFESMDRRYFHLIDRSYNSMDMYSDDFRKEHDKELIFNKFQKIFNNPDTSSYYNKMTHFDMFSSLPALLQVEDRMTMAVSLESRVPLLDRRIVDLVSVMPAGMKFKGAELKYILKKSVMDIVPSNILNRKDKMGFPVPLHIWAKREAHDFIHDTLLSKKCLERGLFNKGNLESLIKNERAFGRTLWGILSLELWFNIFIDQ